MNLPKLKDLYHGYFVRYLPIIAVLAFAFGIWVDYRLPVLANAVNRGVNFLLDSYVYIAPVAIYVILTPSLVKIISLSKKNGSDKFVSYAVCWLGFIRLLASVFAIFFTAFAFGLPLYNNAGVGFGEAFIKTFQNILKTLTSSPYFYALYLSLASVFVAPRIPKLAKMLEAASDKIEEIGALMFPFVPVFMMAIAIYIANLPTTLVSELSGAMESLPESLRVFGTQIALNLNQGAGAVLGAATHVSVFGLKLPSSLTGGVVLVYIVGGLLTGFACFLWDALFLLYTRIKIKDFSIKKYISGYWLRIYPLLWATSSESLSAPLNLHLIKELYPEIREEIRRFVISAGSFLNINGTIICVFILTGLVARLVGVELSIIQLLLMMPVIILMGYGVPGIPGELALFAGPIASFLGMSPAMLSVFLIIYLGLQIGLPDSFRTGTNSTENLRLALLLEERYRERLREKEGEKLLFSSKIATENLAKNIEKR